MSELDGLLNQTVTLETFNSESSDGMGDPSYNTGVSYPARIDRRVRKVVNFEGNEVVSTCLIIIDGAVSLDAFGRDRITLPSSMNSTQPRILAVEEGLDELGNRSHWEIST
jgi:hypothetical protein